jgi:hypothetical protein
MGMRDMACGDAEAYQKLLEGIVMEITGDENAEMRSIAAKIKNTISDQAILNCFAHCPYHSSCSSFS